MAEPTDRSGDDFGAFEYLGEYDRPGVRAFVSELRELYRIGTAIAGEFAVPDGLEYGERGWLGAPPVGYEFLASPAMEAFFEDASPADHPGETTVGDEWLRPGVGIDDLHHGGIDHGPRIFRRVDPAQLADWAADALEYGGAYREFRGSRREAQALGEAFAAGIRDGADELLVRVGDFCWCDWFVYTTHWDRTVVVEDPSAGRIRVVVATDSD